MAIPRAAPSSGWCPRNRAAVLLRREFVAPSLTYFLYASLGAPAHAAKLLAAGLVQHFFQGRQFVGFPRRLVPADAVHARKAHGHARLVAGGALQALEGDLQHQAEVA